MVVVSRVKLALCGDEEIINNGAVIISYLKTNGEDEGDGDDDDDDGADVAPVAWLGGLEALSP